MRTLMLWCPDWPVIAAGITEGVNIHDPVVVLRVNRVLACSPAARAEGIRRGLRKREAQGRCPHLVDEGADHADPLRTRVRHQRQPVHHDPRLGRGDQSQVGQPDHGAPRARRGRLGQHREQQRGRPVARSHRDRAAPAQAPPGQQRT